MRYSVSTAPPLALVLSGPIVQEWILYMSATVHMPREWFTRQLNKCA